MYSKNIKILLADDILHCRKIFRTHWERYFSEKYGNDITECEFASDAIEHLNSSADDHKYYDLVIADIDFSENSNHEGSTAGFEIIELAKKINPRTKVIWYSAQSQETETFDRFMKESNYLKIGLIDFQIKKAWIVQTFKSELEKCLTSLIYEKNGLIFPLSQLFGTYNYASNEDDGFYKLTHSNFSFEEMHRILPKVRNIYNESKISEFLSQENSLAINEYLDTINSRRPTDFEMNNFKTKFRFEFSNSHFNLFQEPLKEKRIECKNDFAFPEPMEIFAENSKISRGFSTIYENIARHNFDNHVSEYVTTHFNMMENVLQIEIVCSGKGFNPQDKFNSNPTGGLRVILDSFRYYCNIIYESNGIGYDIFQKYSFSSQIESGLKIILKFVLPKTIRKNNNGTLLNA